MPGPGLNEMGTVYAGNGEFLFHADWHGARPRVVKIPIAWKVREQRVGGGYFVVGLYQAECKHGVRGMRSFENWSTLNHEERKETVPLCDECNTELEAEEAAKARVSLELEKKTRRERRISSVKAFFRKEWKWALGFATTVAALVIGYLTLVRS